MKQPSGAKKEPPRRSIFFGLSVLLLSAIPALRALAVPGFYTSHDGLTHTARIASFYQALQEGQLPPRLAPNLFAELGTPMFVFIYPLPYLLGSLIHMTGAAFTSSFELVIGGSFILSSLTMFFFAREIFGNLAGAVAALFYTWAPYRLSQMYVRGAIAESLGFVFVPLVLLALYKIAQQRTNRWIGVGSLSLAGLLLSHQLVAFMFLPVMFLFSFLFAGAAKNKRAYFLQAALMLFLGATTSAYIYLPALFERQYLRFNELISYYADHFVTLPQLFHSPWSYGFSMAGTKSDDMSFQIGLTHILVAAMTTAALLIRSFRSRSSRRKPLLLHRSATLMLMVFIGSVVLMLEHPLIRKLWSAVPALATVDFPWRWLGVSVFAASLMAAYLVSATRSLIRITIIGIVVFFVFYANRNHLRINQTVVLSDDFFLQYRDTATWMNEFLTKWRVTNKTQNIESDYRVEAGDLEVKSHERKTSSLKLEVNAKTEGTLNIHRLYFPGWKIFLDNTPLQEGNGFSITSDVQLETESVPFVDRSGLMRIRIPKGEHLVTAKFTETPLRKAGFTVSTIGGVLTLLFVASRRFPALEAKNKKQRQP